MSGRIPSSLSALFGGLSGSSNLAAWALASAATGAYIYYGPQAAEPPTTPAEVKMFNAQRKQETASILAATDEANRARR